MGKLKIINDDVATSDQRQIQSFLADEGIEYGPFELRSRARELAALQTLTDHQRVELIELYADARQRFESQAGYRADVVCFFPELAHLDYIINTFGSIHYHYENEFWYFVDGEATFGFLGRNGTKFELVVEAGEYLQVPEKIWQWFGLTEQKRMKSIRFFYASGSVPARSTVSFKAA